MAFGTVFVYLLCVILIYLKDCSHAYKLRGMLRETLRANHIVMGARREHWCSVVSSERVIETRRTNSTRREFFIIPRPRGSGSKTINSSRRGEIYMEGSTATAAHATCRCSSLCEEGAHYLIFFLFARFIPTETLFTGGLL